MLDSSKVSDDRINAFVLDVFLDCVKVAIQQSTEWDTFLHRLKFHLESWISTDERLTDESVAYLRDVYERLRSIQ